jgi:enoyl-CoA hydratase/carnithine racemase
MYQQILYSVDDPVATITLNRPEVLNAWTDRMGAEVRHAVNRADQDPAVVGVVITGAGRGFCAGADMQTLSSVRDGGWPDSTFPELAVDRDEPVPAEFDGIFTYLLAVRKPIIAAINGPIAGMAVPIALCCDLRFMAADAPLVTAFSQRGLIAEWGISWLLPRLIGTGHALDLLFSSRRITGSEAAAMGLVNAALPAEDVLDYSRGYIQDLARSCAPSSLAAIKRQVYEDLMTPLGPAERDARRLMMESFRRADFKEGVNSFLEKRPPRFGRLGRS